MSETIFFIFSDIIYKKDRRNFMTKLINRPEYLNQLISNKDIHLVKIVTGIRMVSADVGNHLC